MRTPLYTSEPVMAVDLLTCLYFYIKGNVCPFTYHLISKTPPGIPGLPFRVGGKSPNLAEESAYYPPLSICLLLFCQG